MTTSPLKHASSADGFVTDSPTSRRSGLLQAIGPGVMYAGAAIGVSHLVQSTRAGAGYGFTLIWAVIAAHLLKYPFFEFAHRYTATTGESLLCGYRRVGRWTLPGYLLIALTSSVPSAAVLTIVTAGMASQLFPVSLTPMAWAVLLLACCAAVLASGGYSLLDRLMKLLMVFLAVATCVAVVGAVWHGPTGAPDVSPPKVWSSAGIVFLVALMGWMPTPVDASVWPSLWMQERMKQTRHRATLREALFDFHLGYAGSLLTSVMFLSLGALVMFGTGKAFAGRAHDFAAQFVGMYARALGGWSRPVVTAAAFVTMLSTMLTVLDGYPRVLTAGCRLAWPRAEAHERLLYWAYLSLMIVGALLVYGFLTSHMQTLVDFATTVAFLSAPLLAYLNCRAVSAGGVPHDALPRLWLRILSWLGLAFLLCFSALYVVVRVFHAI